MAATVYLLPSSIEFRNIHRVTFRPGRNGADEIADGSFRAENSSRASSELGTVYGGLPEFKARLTGRDWLQKLVQSGLNEKAPGRQEISVPLTIELAGARHNANVRMTVISK